MTPLVVRLNAITSPMDAVERGILAEIDVRVVEIEGATDEEILNAARDADAIMIVSAYLRGPVIEALTRCRVISRLGTGTDKIDITAATAKGIYVVNLPDFCTEEVADHTMALLLSAARRLPFFAAAMRQGRQPHDLEGMHRLSTQTLGLIGFGRIGRAVAWRARAFGLRVLACDPALTADDAAQEGVTAANFDAVLAEADYLALLCPLTPQTRGLLGLREFRRMKPTAVLVNTGRGELVVEEDLVTALREGMIRFAALDVYAGINVFAEGGFPADHPFFGLENVLLTPHVAAYSQESSASSHRDGARAVVEVLTGLPPSHPVNPEVTPWFAGKGLARIPVKTRASLHRGRQDQ
ncbi:MAG: C-terminal binding protein [Armatimonadota bacterium]